MIPKHDNVVTKYTDKYGSKYELKLQEAGNERCVGCAFHHMLMACVSAPTCMPENISSSHPEWIRKHLIWKLQ